MKAPFSYFGGKMKMAERIVDLLPPHDIYVEPFFGSGAVMFAKPPAGIEIAGDLDLAVYTFFKVLREQPEALEMACRLTPYHRHEFAQALTSDDEPICDLERARRFWARVNQSFSKTASDRTGWSYTVARTGSPAETTWNRIARFAPAVERMQRVQWEHADAVDIIRRCGTQPDTVIYLDPPYLAETRNGRCETAGDYRTDMGGIEAHERLAEAAHATDATVVLSGYPSDLYDRLYDGWWRHEIETVGHSSNSLTHTRATRTEVIWANQDLLAAREPTLWETLV